MKKALQYKDQKSDKFWWIETLDAEFVVNYGKVGTIGKYQIKEFDDNESCLKEAQKQIASKLKKGYVEVDFNFSDHLYIDDEEWGLHQLTSHPNFVSHFKDEFYYDCGDEEAPFGSDEGSDALSELHDQVRKNKAFDFSSFPKLLVEKIWGMTYLSVDSLDEDNVRQILESDLKYDLTQSDMVTYAAAFGQIKITGKLNKDLQERAIMAIRRTSVVAKIEGWSESGESKIATQMIKDLESFDILE